MNGVQLVIEGPEARPAAEALLSLPGISANWHDTAAVKKEPVTLATIATIVGIVGGVMTAAEQVRKWYQERKKQPGEPIRRVTLIGRDKSRVSLENASVEQIAQVLRGLEQAAG